MTDKPLVMRFAAMAGERLLAVDEERFPRESRSGSVEAPRGVAIIGLQGALSNRGGMATFRASLARAVANAEVGTIVLDVDSPGGTVAGTAETAAAVAAAADQKRVVAVADSLMASAAYWIGAQASELVVSPSAEVGSIGVLAVHMDLSKALEDFGIKTTIMRSTPFKAEGSPFEPLTEEARASIMGSVGEAHEDFIRAVAAGRGVSLTKVREDFGQGRVVSAQKAVQVGMADRVATMNDVLAGLMSGSRKPRRRSALAFA